MLRLTQEEQRANDNRRVLMIGAHPDDEDTELLTILARGQGMQTAYLSLTRGDGGQNLIGAELGPALGVLRTEELVAARKIDGSRQFFTRAFDFGFSKTIEETLVFWPHDSVLKDMVRVIRRFQPQVMVSVWQGTAVDGHGHHQTSGVMSLEAFHAAGDPARFTDLTKEGLKPWVVSKFYRTVRPVGATATLTFNGGALDLATGLTLHQLAVRSRSQHRSQNQGNLEEVGPSLAGVRLEERAAGIVGPDDSLFAGIAVAASRVPDQHSTEARLTEAGVVLDATVDDDEVTPGQKIPVTLTIANAGYDSIQIAAQVIGHAGFTSRAGQCPRGTGIILPPGALYKCQYETEVWKNAQPTAPYYLQRPQIAGLYQWSGDPDYWGDPSDPPLQARFDVTVLRHASVTAPLQTLNATREVEARFRDPVLGEVRRPVMIVPPITVDLEPNALLWPSTVRSRNFTVKLEHLARDSADAKVYLTVPRGWTTSAPQHVQFTREGERSTVNFKVTAPLKVPLADYAILAHVVVGSDTLDTGLYRIRYPHIRDRNMTLAAQATAVVADVKFPATGTIGYVRGGGDLVPEALANAGLSVSLLTGDGLERAPLDRFKVIVIGPRAYEADESLKRAHPRLMQWLDNGGTLIVEYQQTPYVAGGFPPVPFTLVAPTQSRVTDETAVVTFLAKAHPLLHTPNIITSHDFDGWVQERGLDFPPTWDKAWTPLLEMHDAGSAPLSGGLLIARRGKGTVVYTGLAFHRQLPAIVPGAWRLWANILGAGLPTAAQKR